MRSKSLRTGLVPLTIVVAAAAQEPARPRIEMRLIEMLHENKVISDVQRGELRTMAEEMRREEEAEARRDKDLGTRLDEVAERPARAARVERRKGPGFLLRSDDGDFELGIGGRVQWRFTYDFWDENPDTGGTDAPNFETPRVRLGFQGHAFDPRLKYRLLIDASGGRPETEVGILNVVDTFEASTSFAELKDAFVGYAFDPAFGVRLGQFKIPYSRHALTGVGALQFVDRAITNDVFGAGRDVGVEIAGGFLGKDDDVLAYAAGVFDGEEANAANDDEGLLWAGRLVASPWGAVAGPEGALDGDETFRASLGASARIHQNDGFAGNGDDWFFAADFAARWRGFFVQGEAHYADWNRTGGDDPTAFGWFAQLGRTIVPGKLDAAVRVAHVDWNDNGSGVAAAREYLLAVGYFLHGHDAKLQLDFGYVEDHEGDPSGNREEWRLRTQITLNF
jgi:phosphate-selective porin OprO/OprP